eukprot:767773-Hanusia_phi.AAC.8
MHVAKLWTILTFTCGGKDAPAEIPEACPDYEEYAPDFLLEVRPGYRKNYNDESYLDMLRKVIEGSLRLCGEEEEEEESPELQSTIEGDKDTRRAEEQGEVHEGRRCKEGVREEEEVQEDTSQEEQSETC